MSRRPCEFIEYEGINIHDTFNNGFRLKYAKCIYIPSMKRIYVFGAKHPKLSKKRTDGLKGKKIPKLEKKQWNEIEMKSNNKYMHKSPVCKSIWFL